MTIEPMTVEIVPDSEHKGLVGRLPPRLRGLALLARFDRPIGWWLLFWPGVWAIALAGGLPDRWPLVLWFLLGSVAMRGAGCVFNDIVDRDLDAQVARTRARPIPSGLVSYLGGHQYSGTTENDLNGQRQYLNAFLTPATTYQRCNVFADSAGNVLAASLRYVICRGDSVQVVLPAGPSGPETYRWTPATGLSSASAGTVWARPTRSTDYTVAATSAGGTVRYLAVSVTVLDRTALSIRAGGCPPLAGQEVVFEASAEGHDYRWDFGDGTPADATPRHRYTRPGTYTVRLSGFNAAGCPVAASTVVTVGELLIPNVFTPNHDGQNDTFRLLGVPADVARLEIYSRWGNLVYAANRYAHDWDGGTLPAGTYYYLLRVPDCPTVVKGWVELVR